MKGEIRSASHPRPGHPKRPKLASPLTNTPSGVFCFGANRNIFSSQHSIMTLEGWTAQPPELYRCFENQGSIISDFALLEEVLLTWVGRSRYLRNEPVWLSWQSWVNGRDDFFDIGPGGVHQNGFDHRAIVPGLLFRG